MFVRACVRVCILYFLFKIHFPRNKYRIGLTKNCYNCFKSYFILDVITSCIYIDNGMKFKTAGDP